MLMSFWHLPGNPAYNQNPSALDKELVTRSSLVCGGGKLLEDEYNLGLHVAAVFIVLIQSSLGITASDPLRRNFFFPLMRFSIHTISLCLSPDFQEVPVAPRSSCVPLLRPSFWYGRPYCYCFRPSAPDSFYFPL